MTDTPVVLAGLRLQQRVTSQIDQDIFGAATPLGELAVYAREIHKASTSRHRRVLAFVLETALRRWEYDVSDRPVVLSEMAALRRAFQQPIILAAECLAGKGGDPIEIAALLVTAVTNALPPLNP